MTQTEKELFEKIVRAKVALEGARKSHSMSCPADDGYGSCSCGADATNARIGAALKELD
jgi:hypothetical protein